MTHNTQIRAISDKGLFLAGGFAVIADLGPCYVMGYDLL
jgi:hypothetical protein